MNDSKPVDIPMVLIDKAKNDAEDREISSSTQFRSATESLLHFMIFKCPYIFF